MNHLTNTQPHKQILAIPLQEFVDLVLGDSYTRTIGWNVARLIVMLTNNEHTCYIQTKGREGEALPLPILWNLHQWRISTESWLHAKESSHKRKIAEWIFQANVDRVHRALGKYALGMQGPVGRVVAYQLLKRNGEDLTEKLRMIGVSKLIEKEEEL